jgi:hypothetical protein
MKDTGGPAFARARSSDPAEYHNPEVYHAQEGMTLRDYFAAKAMAALLGSKEVSRQICNDDPRFQGDNFDSVIALNAYEFADAMLAERVK